MYLHILRPGWVFHNSVLGYSRVLRMHKGMMFTKDPVSIITPLAQHLEYRAMAVYTANVCGGPVGLMRRFQRTSGSCPRIDFFGFYTQLS